MSKKTTETDFVVTEFIEDGLREMESILKQAKVGRMALCDGSKPYIIPLNYLYDKGKIAFHCAFEGKKLEIMTKNPNCCFEVDEFKGDVTYHYETQCHLDYDSVLAFGKARIERNEEEKARLLQLFSEQYNERYKRPTDAGGLRIDKKKASECCIVVIDVEELTGRWERNTGGKRRKIMWSHRFK